MREPPLVMPDTYPLMAAPGRRLEVVFTELAGNALRHAHQPVRAWLHSTAQAWLIGIDDAAPELQPSVGTPVTDQIGGRGLAIVLSLTSSAGWYVDNGVKTVWAEVPDTPPAKLLELLEQPRSGLSRSDSDPAAAPSDQA
ncbi:ATP-binding protein [Kineosporia mesophila]|uniref:ATP-binding protein n=1 Tax=Kineosporia mesophila TaxID=566012 RepID=UPI001E5D5324|nr:ATP-binding protein [Kineosporia mesophila]MCD5349330.1 ATP-binding protein [Kineosporia mesophila]